MVFLKFVMDLEAGYTNHARNTDDFFYHYKRIINTLDANTANKRKYTFRYGQCEFIKLGLFQSLMNFVTLSAEESFLKQIYPPLAVLEAFPLKLPSNKCELKAPFDTPSETRSNFLKTCSSKSV